MGEAQDRLHHHLQQQQRTGGYTGGANTLLIQALKQEAKGNGCLFYSLSLSPCLFLFFLFLSMALCLSISPSVCLSVYLCWCLCIVIYSSSAQEVIQEGPTPYLYRPSNKRQKVMAVSFILSLPASFSSFSFSITLYPPVRCCCCK